MQPLTPYLSRLATVAIFVGQSSPMSGQLVTVSAFRDSTVAKAPLDTVLTISVNRTMTFDLGEGRVGAIEVAIRRPDGSSTTGHIIGDKSSGDHSHLWHVVEVQQGHKYQQMITLEGADFTEAGAYQIRMRFSKAPALGEVRFSAQITPFTPEAMKAECNQTAQSIQNEKDTSIRLGLIKTFVTEPQPLCLATLAELAQNNLDYQEQFAAAIARIDNTDAVLTLYSLTESRSLPAAEGARLLRQMSDRSKKNDVSQAAESALSKLARL